MGANQQADNLEVVISAEIQQLRSQLSAASQQIRQFEQQTNRSVDRISGAFGKLKNAIVALGIGKVLKDSFDSVRTYEANIQNLTSLMGESTNQFMGWVQTQAIAFGMAKSEAVGYGAVYSNLLRGFIQDTDTLTGYTTKLLETSAIVASATGRSMQDTLDRIRSGLLGNTEAIEDLGINVNVALIQTTRAFQQLANGRSWAQLDYNTQQQIRLLAILEQASVKYGNSVRNNVNLELARFVANIRNVTLNLGQALLPIFNSVLQILNNFASALVVVTDKFRQFMNALFGVKQSAPSASSNTGVQGIANNFVQAGTAIEESAEKAKGALATFDEVNTLNPTTAPVSTPSGGAVGGGVPLPPLDMGAINDSFEQAKIELSPKMQELVDIFSKFKDINFQPLSDSFGRLKESLDPFFELAWDGFKWALDEIIRPLTQWTIESFLPSFFDLLAAAFDVCYAAIEPFLPYLEKLWDEILKPMAEWTGDAIINFMDWLTDKLKALAAWIKENQDLIVKITAVCVTLIALWQGVKLLAFIGKVGGLGGALQLLGGKISGLVTGALTFFKGKWDSIITTLSLAKTGVMSIGSTIGSVCASAWGALKTFGGFILGGIKSLGTALVGLATNPITWVVLAIGAVITIVVLLIKHWDKVKEVAVACWQAICNTWQSFASWIDTNIVTPVGSFFTRLWDGIKTGCTAAFDTIKSVIKGAANTIITFLNKPIKALNNLLSIKLPDWLGGKSFSVRIPEIPQLARGGIVDSPTVAMIGERGKEAVVPLENTAFVDTLAAAIGQQISQRLGAGAAPQGDTIIQIDGREIARATAKPMRQEFNRLGLI